MPSLIVGRFATLAPRRRGPPAAYYAVVAPFQANRFGAQQLAVTQAMQIGVRRSDPFPHHFFHWLILPLKPLRAKEFGAMNFVVSSRVAISIARVGR